MTQPETVPLNRETVRTIVSHPCRCYLLLELEPAEAVPLDDLVERIASRDSRRSSDSADRPTRRRLAIELAHDHLPRLDAHDVLEYERESAEVVLTVDPGEAQSLESLLAEAAP